MKKGHRILNKLIIALILVAVGIVVIKKKGLGGRS